MSDTAHDETTVDLNEARLRIRSIESQLSVLANRPHDPLHLCALADLARSTRVSFLGDHE